jgi:SAM-dependent methyltransferase
MKPFEIRKPMSPPNDSCRDNEYYRDSAKVPLVKKLAHRARFQAYRLFVEAMAPSATCRIIDVGVSDENATDETNMLERVHPWPESLTCAGIHEGTGFCKTFPNITYTKIKAGAPLPFADKQFDVAYSNAVLEHVGGHDQQVALVTQLRRIARRVFLVVPNRWFPVEHHTAIPFIHWLPPSLFRGILARTHWSYWSKEENLNHLTPHRMAQLFIGEDRPTILCTGVGWGPFKSNIVAYT